MLPSILKVLSKRIDRSDCLIVGILLLPNHVKSIGKKLFPCTMREPYSILHGIKHA